jgi:hypothetical protein
MNMVATMRGSITLALGFLMLGAVPVWADKPDAAAVAFFEKQVRPLLVEQCYNCHSAKANKTRGGLSLDSRSAILEGGDTGPAVVPGKPEQSLLISAVHATSDELQMPPKGKLQPVQIAALEKWVREGAVFPGGSSTPVATSPTDPTSPTARQFWAFQQLKPSPAPIVFPANWPQRPIDSYLLAAMAQHKLTPSAAADRRVLIRRASFDLTGLPPTPAEVEAFVHDSRPDAYAQLVERLLASPHYGERWARYWLDRARYCDVPESWMKPRGEAWPYRDWVVTALNNDLPYDQFVMRQLAADLLPGADPRDRAALGFLGVSPDYWKELQLNVDVIRSISAICSTVARYRSSNRCNSPRQSSSGPHSASGFPYWDNPSSPSTVQALAPRGAGRP